MVNSVIDITQSCLLIRAFCSDTELSGTFCVFLGLFWRGPSSQVYHQFTNSWAEEGLRKILV